jgi:hypothetical protein
MILSEHVCVNTAHVFSTCALFLHKDWCTTCFKTYNKIKRNDTDLTEISYGEYHIFLTQLSIIPVSQYYMTVILSLHSTREFVV